ncbi:MAG: pyrophosphatase [marine bacterium B5-7]|nr:MAG: pyrophosphatase [marine bacterium B5-7]
MVNETSEKAVQGSECMSEYEKLVAPTDKMPLDLTPVLLGLYGEVGSVMATSKKLHREKEVYTGHRKAAIEEFGDVLWYFAAICRRLDRDISQLLDTDSSEILCTDKPDNKVKSDPQIMVSLGEIDFELLRLGKEASNLLSLSPDSESPSERIASFASQFQKAIKISNISLREISSLNLRKTRGRFLDPDVSTLPTFDDTFEADEQLPETFAIEIRERRSGRSYMSLNGVFIGDPLTDNIKDTDGYRFHDVFHLAFAAVLHWSPVFRALIKHKRKSIADIDEQQDSGRAIVVEEGLTAWIFSQAKEIGYFEGKQTVSFDILKTVQNFVAGYEVEACPLKLWEHAILQGYKAFRQVRDNSGGILIGDRRSRTLEYVPLDRED